MTQEINLSHINLLIATPTGEGKLECVYVDALMQTKELLTSLGAKVSHAIVKYCADVSLARNRAFSAFVAHKQFTHCLMIDADMGWNAHDVVRMLLLERDFIGGVGCRKLYPATYCFTQNDDFGTPLAMNHEINTNVWEMTAIGGAFVLVTRNVADKMVEAYPELEFNDDNSSKDKIWGFFDSFVNRGKRRLSDDYAFCHRWRSIGGKVFALLDVTLLHVGSHTFRGNLHEDLVENDPNFKLVEEDNG